MYYAQPKGHKAFCDIPNIEGSPRNSDWRKLICKGYVDKHQSKGTKEFIKEVNDFYHKNICGQLLEKCQSGCNHTKRFDFDQDFGQWQDDFQDINQYLNSIGYSLVIVDGKSKNYIFDEPFNHKNKTTIYIESSKLEGKHNKFQHSFIKNIKIYS